MTLVNLKVIAFAKCGVSLSKILRLKLLWMLSLAYLNILIAYTRQSYPNSLFASGNQSEVGLKEDQLKWFVSDSESTKELYSGLV